MGATRGGPMGNWAKACPWYFICEDALSIYHEVTSRGIDASEPCVGNAMWNFSLSDPDGYRIEFESPTDTPEDTKLSEVAG